MQGNKKQPQNQAKQTQEIEDKNEKEDKMLRQISGKEVKKGYACCMKKCDEILEITDENFTETLKLYGNIVVDCWADWCMPCKMLSEILEEIAEECDDIAFGKLNVDENAVIPLTFKVNAIPSLLLFKKGKFLKKIVGFECKEKLKSKLNKIFFES